MDDDSETPLRSVATPEDLACGAALLGAVEWLGEVLAGCIELPPPLRPRATSIALGESRVPADGERIDFVARVREVHAGAPGVVALRAWLGADLTRWLHGNITGPLTALGVALRAPSSRCVDARDALLARHRAAADAFALWYSVGLGDEERRAFDAASRVALCEAVDRWCALGCESDLGRYVATWQRSASGWAEAALGRGVSLQTEDLGRLRALRVHVRELHARRVTSRQLPRALTARMGIPLSEAERLLSVHDAASNAALGGDALRRRMEVIRPIALAAATLERELRRAPRVEEIALRASVHPCLVELALDAAGSS